MPINAQNQRHFHRHLFAGMNQKVTALKRGDNQQQGTVTTHVMYDCRWSLITKTGETIQGDMNATHRRTLHIPIVEMERIGVKYWNPADRFVDQDGRYWQPESTTEIATKLIEVHHDVECLRVDPPNA